MADTLESREQTGFDGGFNSLGFFAELFFISLGVGYDFIKLCLLLIQVLLARFKCRTTFFEITRFEVNSTLSIVDLLAKQLDFEALEFDLL